MTHRPNRKPPITTIIWSSLMFVVVASLSAPHAEGVRLLAAAEDDRPQSWTPAMQLEVRRMTNPRLSPSGEKVLFEVAHADLESNRWAVRLHLALSTESGPPVILPNEGCRDARWGGVDSKLYVMASDDENRDRVHGLDLDTGMLTPITPEEDQVGWFDPSPDGAWIAYTTYESESGASPRWSLHAVSTRGEKSRHWKALRSVAEFSWSPASDRIVAVYQPAATLDWRQKSLALLELASDTVIPLDTGPGATWMPQFGPEGKRVAFVASPGAATWMRDAELRVLDLVNNALTTLAPTPDRNVDLLAWRANGEALLGLEYEGSTRRLLAVPLDGGPPEYLGPASRSLNRAHVQGDRIAFTSERWNEPVEVFASDLPNLAFNQVSSVQPKLKAPLGHTTTVRWESDDGIEVEGLLTYPVDYREGKRVPLLVRLHGGPPFPAADSFIGGTYMTAYPLASLASAGFAILQPNFRGSAGYGRPFRHGLHDEWGGQDYRDVIAGVDALIARGVADPKRLGVMGWSYGGYLTAWTITQDSRFAAASMGAAMTDLVSFDETTTLGGMLGDWFGGTAEEQIQKYRESSPIRHAQKVRCPVLVQHGTMDRRVPLAQATSFMAAIEGRGLDLEYHPYEGGHGPRSPKDELAVLQQNLDWFKRLLGDGKAVD